MYQNNCYNYIYYTKVFAKTPLITLHVRLFSVNLIPAKQILLLSIYCCSRFLHYLFVISCHPCYHRPADSSLCPWTGKTLFPFLKKNCFNIGTKSCRDLILLYVCKRDWKPGTFLTQAVDPRGGYLCCFCLWCPLLTSIVDRIYQYINIYVKARLFICSISNKRHIECYFQKILLR